MEYLFVYGRLMGHETNLMAIFLKNNAKPIGQGYMHGRIYNLGNYPGVIPSNNEEEKVFGEIYQIDNPEVIFTTLDDFEEAWPLVTEDPEYSRTMHDVFLNNIPLPCWVYIYNWSVDEDKQIISGKFN